MRWGKVPNQTGYPEQLMFIVTIDAVMPSVIDSNGGIFIRTVF